MRSEVSQVLAGLLEYRRELDARREQLAAEAAQALIRDLAEFASGRSYPEVEDELCVRMGRQLRGWADGPIEDHIGPNTFAAALRSAAVETVCGKLQDVAIEPNSWHRPWLVLTAVIRTGAADEGTGGAIAELRSSSGAEILPELPDGPVATSPILWVRDAYGSRFG